MDIGAGTWRITRLIAEAVGPKGRVYAMALTQELLGPVHAGKGTVTDESKKAGIALAAEIAMAQCQ